MARNSHRIIPISYSRKVAASVVLVSGGLFLTPFIIKSIGVLPVYQIGVLGLLSVLMIYITLSNRASASIEDKS